MIILKDLERWKQDSIQTAIAMGYTATVLERVKEADIEVISGTSGRNLYGWAQTDPPLVQVYAHNPARNFPRIIQEVWNQSGMDHELLGHIYNYWAGKFWDEIEARQTQIEVAHFRAESSTLWGVAARVIPVLLHRRPILMR